MAGRVAVGLSAVFIAVLGIAFVKAGVDLAQTPIAKDVNAGVATIAAGQTPFNGAAIHRDAEAALSVAAGVAAILALIPGLAYAFARRWLFGYGAMVMIAVALALLYGIAVHLGG